MISKATSRTTTKMALGNCSKDGKWHIEEMKIMKYDAILLYNNNKILYFTK